MTTIDDQAAPIAIPIRPDETKAERNERLRLLARSPTFLLGSILVGVWIVCAILGNLIAPHDPVAPDILSKFEGPSGAHLFGTDKLGQDVAEDRIGHIGRIGLRLRQSLSSRWKLPNFNL